MAEMKTKKTKASVEDFLNKIKDQETRQVLHGQGLLIYQEIERRRHKSIKTIGQRISAGHEKV